MLLYMHFMLLCLLQNGLVSCTCICTLKLGCKQSPIMLEIVITRIWNRVILGNLAYPNTISVYISQQSRLVMYSSVELEAKLSRLIRDQKLILEGRTVPGQKIETHVHVKAKTQLTQRCAFTHVKRTRTHVVHARHNYFFLRYSVARSYARDAPWLGISTAGKVKTQKWHASCGKFSLIVLLLW